MIAVITVNAVISISDTPKEIGEISSRACPIAPRSAPMLMLFAIPSSVTAIRRITRG
jgi:hypothetical protein